MGTQPASPRPLPGGLVFFLLTDVEGSTQMWEQNEELMRSSALRCEQILKTLLEQWGGALPADQGEGDSLVAAFTSGMRACGCGLEIQRALGSEAWPDPLDIRVRIGIHCGQVDPVGTNYRGPALNRAARVRDSGHGGQILISQPAAEAMTGALPDGTWLEDLGLHRFKGISLPERIFQLCHLDLQLEFPALRSPRHAVLKLPASISRFVGRDSELQELTGLLRRHRLLTIAGLGGSGKTTLAVEMARRSFPDFEDGVVFVDLSHAAEGGVEAALGPALEVRDRGRPLMDSITDTLGDRALLLLLDNCENVISETARLSKNILSACDRVKIVLTSRQPADLEGEAVWRIPHLRPGDAVALFTDRAATPSLQFRTDDHLDAVIQEICSRLDGLPLAIELAARLTHHLSVNDIRSGLDSRFELLSGLGARDDRERSLRSVIDWSYDLLDDRQKQMLLKVAVIRGSFSLAAAGAVSGHGPDQSRSSMIGLVGASLIDHRVGPDSSSYFMPESIREYGIEKLTAAGGLEDARHAYTNWAMSVVDNATPHLRGAEQADWLDRLEQEYESIVGAVDQSIENRDASAALKLSSSLWWFWYVKGHLSDGRRRLEAVASIAAGEKTPELGSVLRGASTIAYVQGDSSEARRLAEQSLRLYQQVQNESGVASALNNLGNIALGNGDASKAEQLFQESLEKSRTSGDQNMVAIALNNLGHAALAKGEERLAMEMYEQGLALARELGDVREIVRGIFLLARLSPDRNEALTLYREALHLSRKLGDKTHIGHSLLGVASVKILQGDAGSTKDLLEEALSLGEELGEKELIGYAQLYLGKALRELGEDEEIIVAVLEQANKIAKAIGDAELEDWATKLLAP